MQSSEEYWERSQKQWDDLLYRLQNNIPPEPNEELDRLADEVIRRGEERKAFLATLSPEEFALEKERERKQDEENFVRFMMNDSFGGP